MEAADLHRMSPTMISSLPPKRSARHSKARLSARRIRIPNARCPGCPGSLPVSADGIATTSRPVRRPCEPDGPNLPTGRKAIVLQWLCKMCESRSPLAGEGAFAKRRRVGGGHERDLNWLRSALQSDLQRHHPRLAPTPTLPPQARERERSAGAALPQGEKGRKGCVRDASRRVRASSHPP